MRANHDFADDPALKPCELFDGSMPPRGASARRALSPLWCSLPAVLALSFLFATASPSLAAAFLHPWYAGRANRSMLCLMHRPQRVFSTRRDLVATSVFQRHPNVRVNLLSIRSTGCNARILLLAETGHAFEDAFLSLCAFLEVEIALFNYTPGFHTDIYRSEWLLAWLAPRAAEFDRVFYIDAFDAFFQMDPFDHLVEKGLMTFVSEGPTIENQPSNFRMIAACFGRAVAVAVSPYELICSGSVAGDVTAYVKYLRVLTENLTRWHSPACANDQQQINGLAWTGELAKAGVRFRIEGCNGTVNSMYNCRWNKIDIGNGFFDLSENKRFVNNAVMHHYKQWEWVVKNYYERCGMELPAQWTYRPFKPPKRFKRKT
jgi:hypothetical protein